MRFPPLSLKDFNDTLTKDMVSLHWGLRVNMTSFSALSNAPRIFLGRTELLWFLWIMPIHQTIPALLSKRSDERLTAVRARGCSADCLGAASVLHPNLCPRNRTTRSATQLLHRHRRSLVRDDVTNASGVGLRQIGELWNMNAALGADRPALRQLTA